MSRIRIKLYRAIGQSDDCLLLQSAATTVADWAAANHLTLSESKCLVLKTKEHPFVYTLNNVSLADEKLVRDLGVTMDPSLRFSAHVVNICKSASNTCNLILRTFISRKTEFYLELYRALVLSRLLYCSEVWSPATKGDIRRLERLQSRFLHHVARRCRLDQVPVLPSIQEEHERADARTFRQLIRSPSAQLFFRVAPDNRRSGVRYLTKCIAKTNTVNNFFAWRVTRRRDIVPTHPLQ